MTHGRPRRRACGRPACSAPSGLSAPKYFPSWQALEVDRYPTLPLMQRAYELRANLTPYDAAYVALAEVLACGLLTGDQRLAGAPGPRCPIRVL